MAVGPVSFRCQYGAAIAQALHSVAEELLADWASDAAFASAFAAPTAASDPYRSSAEVAGEIVKAIATGLQYVAAAEIKPALGAELALANGNRAPLRRSGTTFVLVAAQVEGLYRLLSSTGWLDLDDATAAAIAGSVAFDLDRVRETVSSIETSPEVAFESDREWEKLRYATVVLDYAARTVSESLSGALGLVMGFNALDGD